MRLNREPLPLSPARRPIDTPAKPEPAADAAQRFEGFMLGEMLKAMRETEMEGRGIIRHSRAERIFLRQQCEVLGEVLAEREPLGLARMLKAGGLPQPDGTRLAGGSHHENTDL